MAIDDTNSGSKSVNESAMKKLNVSPTTLQTAKEFLRYVNHSPSPFHATHEAVQLLEKAGFKKLLEREDWNGKLKNGEKYYVTRNQSSVVAFAIGGKFTPGNGFHIVGAHTDSPCLKVKPISKISSSGWLQVGVECYGGALFHTWFDRDLSIAGRVIVEEKTGVFGSRLLLVDRPIMRIPTLAIHLDREVSSKGFIFNNENQLRPVLATAARDQLEALPTTSNVSHHPGLLNLIAQELSIEISQIHDFELCLYDTQGAAIGGLYNEFIFSPRLDNLCCSWVSVEALIRSLGTLPEESGVRVVCLFDNEEVGSNSLMGAASNHLEEVMKRVSGDSCFGIAARKSMMISADMAHGVHPNYPDKHETNHRPAFHSGPVIKYNANQRYATTGETSFLLKHIAKKHNIDLQEFVVRQDSPCGSTIGPILATRTGIRTLDIGIAQLSMHSIREMCGTEDLEKSMNLFQAFYSEFTQVDSSLTTD